MRLTSAFSRRADPRAACGFTLLEVLLVLALLAMLTGLVAPRMWQWVQSARVRAGIDTARAAIEALPSRAFSHARRITLDEKSLPSMPAGWRLEVAAPVAYEANGMTSGGRVRISDADHAVVLADWMIDAPAGTVRTAQTTDGPFSVLP